ncbi:hypothetical protein RHGRI_031435 [Rhododendron griersonianum]|uniref:GPI-anchored wall transfer protein n=1 Tax=Rhododendron griersonianum TaxID=479676 RepID=A0AAV6IBP1_9ERIC|nr:hypothetical protein RHGRI_031435 [Rhododendron griersonianum]KAG5524768.1 hypothetical protein RHGRI_031435 [Rhododendron griersonianum]KAG5524769.1 hypothetical protein RHGRI_031435 [Rhododendron griersonianum]
MDTPVNSFNPYKHLKEQFVSNLTGSSMLEIIALATAVPVLILLRRCFCSNGMRDGNATKISSKKNDDVIVGVWSLRAYMAAMLLDFLLIILPLLLFFTVLSEWTSVAAVLLTLLLISLIAAKRYGASIYLEDGVDSLRSNISSYRVSIMVVTCLCILAVDFRIFPRRYAKTETYGTSLMDLGVGSFVLANSLVSRQARGFPMLKLKNALQSSSPLVVLGIARLLSTAGVDYQVHVGEYGVHWNFFFTLAAVSILSSIINIPPKYSGILGSLIVVGYQVCLINGLNVYLLSNERGTDIISQNKEGIFSIFGYWGMYLVGVQLGSYLFFGNSKQVLRSNNWAKVRVGILSLLFWLLTVILDRKVERVSRRTCNVAYVTFVLAQNLQVLAILMLSDYIPGHKISVLEEAFNRNLLASFLLANVLTGVVNLFIETLFASSALALAVLVVYAFVLFLLVGLANFYGIKSKFW